MRDEDIVILVKTCWSDLPQARELIQNDISILNERTRIDETVLMLLIRWYIPEKCNIKQHIEAVQMLIDFGADVNGSNNCGSSPLHNAISSGQSEVIKLLLLQGANINPKYGFLGQPTLHLATLHENVEEMKLLLENGANINALDDFGQTPLHLAVENDKKIELTKLLVSYGAGINTPSDFGYTPLDEAYSNKSMLNVKYLIDIGSLFGKTNVDNMLEMDYKEELHFEILDYFSEQSTKTK